jgi:tRNA G18 (ribose-2'-O)-methylase SpoU
MQGHIESFNVATAAAVLATRFDGSKATLPKTSK